MRTDKERESGPAFDGLVLLPLGNEESAFCTPDGYCFEPEPEPEPEPDRDPVSLASEPRDGSLWTA
jgi:hypothetical protein